MSHTYTNYGMADMHLAYGLIEDNASRHQLIYRNKYPTRLVPHTTTI